MLHAAQPTTDASVPDGQPHRVAAASRWTPWVFAGCWLVLLVGGRSRLLRDPGTFWHVVVGDRILASGFPHTDWLSFTFAGKPWIAHQWLAECVMSLLHRAGGLDALVVATAAALAFLFAWVFDRLVLGGVSPLWALLFVAIAFLTSSLHFHVRPHVVSIVLFAVFYGWLIDIDDGMRRPVQLLWAVPVFAAWVNCHGGALAGLATVGAAVAAWNVSWLSGRASPVRTRRDAVTSVFAVAAACATIPLTPYGLDVARTWLAILRSKALPVLFVEHASLAATGSWQILLLAAVYVAALAGPWGSRLRPTAWLPGVWLALAFMRVRNAPLFATAAVLALPHLLRTGTIPRRFAARGIRIVADRPAPMAVRSAWRIPASVTIGAVLVLLVAFRHVEPEGGDVVARLDPAHWPVAFLPELRREAARLPPGAPILNDMLFGGFIAHQVPRLRVLVDDRWELYGDDFVLSVTRGERAWLDELASRSGAVLALAQRGSPLDAYVASNRAWSVVGRTTNAALYRRTVSGGQR